MNILRVFPHRGSAALLVVLGLAWTPAAPAASSARAAAPVALATADEVHWTLTGSGAVTLSWRGADNTVRYGLTTSYGSIATATTPIPTPTSSPGPFWEARLTGLLPDTVYHYAIGANADHTFRTAPPRGASGFDVFAEGDIGSTLAYWRMGVIQSQIAAARPRFVLALGDLTYGNDHGMAAVDQHFNDVMVWSQDAAYMPAWGNHDWEPNDNLNNYKGRFHLPNPRTSPGAPTPGGEDWYWFDYGNVRFIAYPEPWSGAWADWAPRADALMDSAQADAGLDFIVTFGHRPAYSSGWHAGSSTLKGHLDALGAQHSKYVLNLNGHSHDYERTHPQSGVVHVTVGTGGSSLEQIDGSCLWAGGCPPPSWSAFRAMHHGALRLRFSRGRIDGAAICGPAGDADRNRNDIVCEPGSVMDAFTIGSGTPGDAAPIVSAPASVTATAGTTLTVSVVASDPDGDPIAALTADLSALPAGHGAVFAAAADRRSGTLSWTPSTAHAGGPWPVSFTATNALSGSVSTGIAVVDPSANLAGNPSFESGTSGWTAYHGSAIARVAGGCEGAYALRVTGPNNIPPDFGVNDSPNWIAEAAPAGTTFRFSAWVRSAVGRGRASLQIREFKDGIQHGSATYSTGVTLGPAWQRLNADHLTAISGSTLDFQVIDAPLAKKETFDVDQISIHRVPSLSAATPSPVAISARVVPNPAHGAATLSLVLPEAALTRIELLDVQGRVRRTLLERTPLGAGSHTLRVEARDDRGARLGPGVYFCRVASGKRTAVGRFLLVE